MVPFVIRALLTSAIIFTAHAASPEAFAQGPPKKPERKIMSVTENEEFISYYPVNDNAVRWERSTKLFTQAGKPKGLKECHGVMTRIAPFTPTANQAQLAKDLSTFLQHN